MGPTPQNKKVKACPMHVEGAVQFTPSTLKFVNGHMLPYHWGLTFFLFTQGHFDGELKTKFYPD